MLFQYFDYIRGGRGSAKKIFYYPQGKLPGKCLFSGTGIGMKYGSKLSVLKRELNYAAETDSVLVYYSHNIDFAERIGQVDMRIDWLEELLAHAKKLDLRLIGFDELNAMRQ